jgi:glycosyltransferase involved in cell wall biosynthesis
MTSEPLVTVFMPARNEEKYIGAAIDSIIHQSYRRLEILVIDDYSNDGTVRICNGFRDKRIRVYAKRNEPRGDPSSRNLGLDLASGEFLINQDADDYSTPDRVEKQLMCAMEAPERRFVGCWVRRVLGSTEAIWKLPERHSDIVRGFERVFNRASIVAGTALASLSVLRQVRYRPWVKHQCDWDYILRLHETGNVEFCNWPEPLYTYNLRPKGGLGQPDWITYNILVRASQYRRRHGVPDYDGIDDYHADMRKWPSSLRWRVLGKLLGVRNRITTLRNLRSTSTAEGSSVWQ